MREKELSHSFDKTYELYFHLLWLTVEITRYCENKIEMRRNKLCPQDEDLNPNLRFVNNVFIKQLSENQDINDFIKAHKLSWANYPDVVKDVSEQVLQSAFYRDYMTAENTDYQEDKSIWKKIFKNIILTNEALESALEEQNIYWADDVDIVISFIIKTIRHFEHANGKFQALVPQFADETDHTFAKKLLGEVIRRHEELMQLIDNHTKNWEIDRIADMDILIMETALAEIWTFPNIPIKVSFNEYIEIAKSYSTEKSSQFVNGILDKIVQQLKNEKLLLKVVDFTKEK